MRFQSTFRRPTAEICFYMRRRRKPRRGYPGAQPSPGALLDQALAACAQLPAGELKVLREYFAETARKVFQAGVAGILVKHGAGYTLRVFSPPAQETHRY